MRSWKRRRTARQSSRSELPLCTILSDFQSYFSELFDCQFLGALWNEEMPLDWGALYGGNSDPQSFCHLFCKMCFDECLKTQAAIDTCLRNRGSFGPMCSVDCNQRHDDVACSQCGQYLLLPFQPYCKLHYHLQGSTTSSTATTRALMLTEA